MFKVLVRNLCLYLVSFLTNKLSTEKSNTAVERHVIKHLRPVGAVTFDSTARRDLEIRVRSSVPPKLDAPISLMNVGVRFRAFAHPLEQLVTVIAPSGVSANTVDIICDDRC